MASSLRSSWILVLVLMLRPVVTEMEIVQATEERKYENRKLKELISSCDEKECQGDCEKDGFWRGRCFGDACVCFEMKKVEAAADEKRQLSKDHPNLCTDPQCAAACKKDGFCSGQCLEYICYCLPNCTTHHQHYPPQLN